DFLKRFQKLENQPTDWSVKSESMSATRRFERLEVNDKRIEVAISDRATAQEKAPTGTNYIRMCPYCGAENVSSNRECVKCRHSLSDYFNDYGGQEGKLKKCVCGALNLKERKFCWVCGRDFSLWGDSQVVPKQENIIVLTIDDQTYRSTDPDLPPGIVKLMERIRREGYSKELIDEWIRTSNDQQQLQKQEKEQEIRQNIQRTQTDLTWHIIGIAIVAALIILRIWASSNRYH
ncbi:MAG: zinc ribbon domain-containing protein, partial [Deltaproteobacteria bacterium]